MIDRLRGDHHGGAEDIAGGGTTADLGRRLAQTGEDRAVVARTGEDMDQFRGDIG